MAPASYEGGHHKIPVKGRKSGKLRQCSRSPLFAAIFPEVVILAYEMWEVFCIYPRDNNSRDNFSNSLFEQQHFIPVLTIPGIADLSLGLIALSYFEQPGPGKQIALDYRNCGTRFLAK